MFKRIIYIQDDILQTNLTDYMSAVYLDSLIFIMLVIYTVKYLWQQGNDMKFKHS